MREREWEILLDVIFEGLPISDFIEINTNLNKIGSYIKFSKSRIRNLYFEFLGIQKYYEESFIENREIKNFHKVFNLQLKLIKEENILVHKNHTSADFIYEILFAGEHLCYLKVSDVKNITNVTMSREQLDEWSVEEIERVEKIIETYI